MLLKNDFLPSRIADKLDDVDRDLDFFPLKMLNDDELDDDADECADDDVIDDDHDHDES